MKARAWPPPKPQADREFRVRHFVAWVLFLFILKWTLEFLWDAKQSGGFTLLPAVLLTWAAVFTAGACIEHWLEGANRSGAFRAALAVSALASCVLWVWMMWQYAVFLFVGIVTLFRRPLHLFSLAAFGEGLFFVSLGVVTFGVFTWASLRVVAVLLSGERHANLEQVLGNESFGGPPSATQAGAPERTIPVPATRSTAPQPAVARTGEPQRRFPPALRDPVVVMPGLPAPQEPIGKQRHLSRPPALACANHHPVEPSVLRICASNEGGARDPRCNAVGWEAVEWVLRTKPSMPEVADALAALPRLAPAIDAQDAAEVRDWISRLADYPGAYEVDLPPQEIKDPYVRTRTVRIADVALQAMIAWDDARAKVPQARPCGRERRPIAS